MLFFSCTMSEKSTKKAGFEVCGWLLRSIGKETHLQRRAYLCMSAIWLAFIVCIQAAFKLQVKGLLTWVWKEKQIYIHTHTHTFRKTISGNQAHVWFKKLPLR